MCASEAAPCERVPYLVRIELNNFFEETLLVLHAYPRATIFDCDDEAAVDDFIAPVAVTDATASGHGTDCITTTSTTTSAAAG